MPRRRAARRWRSARVRIAAVRRGGHFRSVARRVMAQQRIALLLKYARRAAF